MILFPAIDLKNGEAVRLQQGDMARATTAVIGPPYSVSATRSSLSAGAN